MRTLTFLPVVAALISLASAAHRGHASTAHRGHNHFTLNNGTHFVDPYSQETIQNFNCDVHQGKASAHFNKTIKRLHQQHQYSNVGTRAALPALKKVPKKKKQTTTTTATSSTAASASPSAGASTSIPAGSTGPSSAELAQASISGVPLYFHVISTAAHNGTITPAMVAQQAATLNSVYNQYGISFNLINTSWTVNDAWAIAAGTDMDAAKAALRVGTYSSLNIYFHTDLAGGNLGTCTLPSQVPSGATQQTYVSDGCDVNANTMPGGSMAGYNQGMTAVHETGHWLGLLHTFEGYDCSGDGDYIDDTRFEAQSTNGCPTNPPKNTCPTLPGVDPIHNYMDYSTDACYEAFTPGQVARIQSLWTEYRAGN